ncbi:MAG: 5-(carboxyamino)imidazole ribonucleotide mutase [Candidatus Omnitrophica bacterium]|nr:5-(carboxyamino)imidazole ribonucleotide mutase [Candidatus Omnitrophota bacterium]
MKNVDVAIVMGSDSDLPVMQSCIDTLQTFNIISEAHVMSAHRTPHEVSTFAQKARECGIKVIIAGAGGAAHLAGVIASHTTLPVIGVPLASSCLNGLDALLATVQMPSGIPVATVAIGKAGAVNAALLAIEILSLSDQKITQLLDTYKSDLIKKVKQKNNNLKSLLNSK